MLCEVLSDLMGQVTCAGAPAWEATALAAAIAAVSLVVLARHARGNFARGLAAMAAVVLAAGLLSVAAARPSWQTAPADLGAGGVVVVLVDQSQSVWRDPADGQAALESLASVADGLTGGEGWQAQVIGFGTVPQVLSDLPSLADLGAAVRRAIPDPPQPDSNLNEALAAARATVADQGGRGIVLVLTDGQTDPPDDALIRSLIASGVVVHVLATGSDFPERGLISADIGPVQRIGVPAMVRGTTLGEGLLHVATSGGAVEQPRPDLPDLQPVRAEVVFVARGLEPVSLSFVTEGNTQARTLFTLVRGPARVLVFGAAPWLDGLNPARWQIERADPQAPIAPDGRDLVVIDALSPADFAPGYADRLFAAADGTGVLIVNGPQRGALTDTQRISDWNASTLSPILPVDSNPRAFVQSPPPRDVVIMIDASGSMNGAPLYSGKSVASKIVEQLNPQDTIWIIPFTDTTDVVFPRQKVNDTVRAEALAFIQSISADGGTDLDSALDLARTLRSNQCAFFMISDGLDDPPNLPPMCRTYAIGVNSIELPGGEAFWGKDQTRVLSAGETANLRFEYLEPEIRDEFYRPGAFEPRLAAGADWLPQPPTMDGVAITYPRSDSGVQVLAVHPMQPPDPAIVLRRDPARPSVATGVILGGIPARHSAAGVATLDALMTELTGWNDPDRYDIRITTESTALRFRITALADEGRQLPATLSASVLLPDGRAFGLGLSPAGEAGQFAGRVDLPADAAGLRAMLVISEQEGERRIPLRLPDLAARGGGVGSDEALDFGVDQALLSDLVRQTGGTMPPSVGSLSQASVLAPEMPLAAWFIATALLTFAASFWIGGTRP